MLVFRLRHGAVEHVVQILFPSRGKACIDVLEYDIHIQIVPCDGVDIETVWLAMNPGLIVGADVLHIASIVLHIRAFAEALLHAFDSALI